MSKIDLNDELKCAVCRDVCTAPPRECTICAHLFCYKCIADLKTCPLCRIQPFDVRICWFASRLLNSVHVKCVQCGAMVVRTHLESHNAEVCEARLRQSSFPDIEFVANNKQEVTDHMKEQHLITGILNLYDFWAVFKQYKVFYN